MARTRRRWRSPVVSVAAVLLAYYAVPVGQEPGSRLAVGLLLTLVAVGALGWAIVVQVRRQLGGVEEVGLQTLVTLLSLVVVVFALSYFLLDRARPGEIIGLETRTDALYFTLVTLATVGFGDIHAEGQVARALVTLQIVFNVVVVASAASIMTGRLRERAARAGRQSRPSPDEPDESDESDGAP